jgi:hypothetical protein
VDGTGDHLLASATLAENQHRVSTLRCLTDDAVEPIHLRRTPDDFAKALIGLNPLTQAPMFDLMLEVGLHSFQQELQFFQGEGLGHVLVGAVLHRLHCGIDRGIRTDDNDFDIWASMLDLAQDGQPAWVGQVQVKKDDIDSLGTDEPKPLVGGLRGAGVVSESGSRFAAGVTDQAVIVHDEQV